MRIAQCHALVIPGDTQPVMVWMHRGKQLSRAGLASQKHLVLNLLLHWPGHSRMPAPGGAPNDFARDGGQRTLVGIDSARGR
jgi:hypothetical protein